MTYVDIMVDVAVGERGVNEGEHRPVGAPVPSILEIEGPLVVTVTDPDGTPVTDAAGKRAVTLVIDSSAETEWRVLATAPDETAVAFTVEADAQPRIASQEALT